MKVKFILSAFLVSLVLCSGSVFSLNHLASAVFSPYLDIDHFEAAPRVAEVRLINERSQTHHWEYSLSDEAVLSCVGTRIRDGNTEFDFSGVSPGMCDVTFRYKKRFAPTETILITEVYRFYVDTELGVTCERIHFSTNER